MENTDFTKGGERSTILKRVIKAKEVGKIAEQSFFPHPKISGGQ